MKSDAPPLIAILRGIKPTEIVPVGESLVAAGIKYIEVPLNSPDPFTSIEMLLAACGNEATCGAGTVTSLEQLDRLTQLGAKLVVSPHLDEQLVEAATSENMMVLPGVATVTEAYRAIAAGATDLKLFPAGDIGANFLSSIREVLPVNVNVYAVGRIAEADLPAFWQAGATGFGIGSGLYRPGDNPDQVYSRAQNYVAAVSRLVEGDK